MWVPMRRQDLFTLGAKTKTMAKKMLSGMDVGALEKFDEFGVTNNPDRYAHPHLELVADVDGQDDDGDDSGDAGDEATGPLKEYKIQRSLLAESLAVTAGAFIRCLAGLTPDGVIEMST